MREARVTPDDSKLDPPRQGPQGGDPLRLDQLPPRTAAVVDGVDDRGPGVPSGAAAASAAGVDQIARRLRELGFVDGERVEVVASGPFGGDPLLVQVGFTRFALRRSEAARVRVRRGAA